MNKITPFLWFERDAEQAAKFYCSIFKNSTITKVTRYGKDGASVSGQPAGSVMTVAFTLDGNPFVALNGGPVFKFSPATSFIVSCKTQKEVDHFWNKLSTGGRTSMCGWLDDKYGVTWQIVPNVLDKLVSGPNPRKASAAMRAMLQMTKLDVALLKKAYAEG